MKKHYIHIQKGFTLVEVLIYIVLFGLLMTGAVVSAYQLLQSGEHQSIGVAAQQEGTFINRKLAWALAPATAVSVSGGNVLSITRTDLPSGQSPLVFDGSGTRMTLKRGSGAALPLSSDGLELSNVSFSTTPPANGLPEAVRVSYTLGGKDFTYAMYLRQ
jgi:prepilin-type N-terminal cleavage/methylation domain-containing protein